MKTFEKESNGFTLKIIVNREALMKELDEIIENTKGDVHDDSEDGTLSYYTEVNGDYEEYVSMDTVINDLNKFRAAIDRCDSNPDYLFGLMTLKKNGTFKKNVKPTIESQDYGPYWEDSYGWHIHVLRIEPMSDTEAIVTFNTIVEHY